MIPFNTQLFLSSSTIQIALRLTLSSPCCNSVFRYDFDRGRLMRRWLYSSQEGSNWSRGWEWPRDGEGCERRRPHARVRQRPRAGRLGMCACTFLIQPHPGFVSSLCSPLCRRWVSLRQSFRPTCMAVNNNRCTGLKEIRLRDTQLKINKKK